MSQSDELFAGKVAVVTGASRTHVEAVMREVQERPELSCRGPRA
jgi:ribosomal silencing factor RsfS